MKKILKKIKPMLRRAISFSAISMALTASPMMAKQIPSSTFVGNGGDVQDLDLSVTLAAINSVARNISGSKSETLCVCSEDWQENDICKILRQMNKEEVAACRRVLTTYGSQLAALSARNSPVEFAWSEGGMMVQPQAQSQKARPVDAVTQRVKNKIIINRNRFSNMPASYRVALVTHELFHLIKIGDDFMTDEGPAAPFASGRAMLNVLGAAAAMEANEGEVFQEFKSLQTVSRSQRQHWLMLDLGSVSHPDQTSKPLLKNDGSSQTTVVGYSYRQGQFGLDLGLESIRYTGRTSGIDVNERLSIYHVAPHYRIHPINKYLSRWNELFVTIGLDIGSGTVSYSASTLKVEKKDESQVLSFGASLRAYIPLINNFWITSAIGARQLNYDYKKLRTKTIENQTQITIGGAYGF